METFASGVHDQAHHHPLPTSYSCNIHTEYDAVSFSQTFVSSLPKVRMIPAQQTSLSSLALELNTLRTQDRMTT